MSKIKDFLKSPLGTALCAAAACLLAVVLVWLAAVRPNNDKSLSERISDDYSQYSAELDEANGAAQTFDTDNDLLAMAFVFGTSNGQPTGELHLELADADTGEVLARSTGDMANIVAGQYTGMGLDTPVTGSAGRRYRVTLKPEYTGSGRLTVGCSNGAVLWNDTFTVNGEAVDGTLALLVTYKQIGGFLTRFFLLVGLLASVVVFLGIYFAMRGRMPLHRLVFVLVLCFGMLYSFVLPPYAAPDEKYHINQSFTLACKWANMLSPDEWRMGNVPLDMTYRREHDFDPLLQNEKTTVFSWQELSENLFTTTPDSFDSHTALEELQTDRNPTLYLFSAAAVFLAYVFHLGFVPALMLGRTANLIVFALLAALAVKAAPFGRRVFAAAALLPMTLHLAASYSRDSNLLALCFFFAALMLELAFGPRERLGWKQLVPAVVLALVLVPCKMVYLPLAALVLLIPAARLGRFSRWLKAGFLALCLVAFLTNTSVLSSMNQYVQGDGTPAAGAVSSEASDPAEPEQAPSAGEAAGGANSISTAEDMICYTPGYILSHPLDTAELCIRSVVEQGDHYLSTLVGGTLGYFGLDKELDLAWGWVIALYALLGLAWLCPGSAEMPPSRRWACLAIGLCCCALAVAGCIIWTPTYYTTIYGFQGRYFLPVLPLLLLAPAPRCLRLREDCSAGLVLALALADVGVLLNAFLGVVAR